MAKRESAKLKYRPVPTPAPSQQYLEAELRSLQQATEIINAVTLTELNAEPTRIEDGQIVYADGSNWNPGDGESVYARVNGAWQSLVGVQPDEAETITGDWTFSGSNTFSEMTTFTKSRDGNTHAIDINSTAPALMFTESDAGTDLKKWHFTAASGNFYLRDLNDDGTNKDNLLIVDRTNSLFNIFDGFDIRVGSNEGIHSYNASGVSNLDLDAIVGDGTSDPTVRIGRGTNTTGEFDCTVYRGDGTSTAVTITRYDNTAARGEFMLRNATRFQVYNSTNTDYSESWHNGSDIYTDHVNTGWRRYRTLDNGVLLADGAELRLYETTDTDYLSLQHNSGAARIATDGSYGIEFASDVGVVEGVDFRLALTANAITAAGARMRANTQVLGDDATGTFEIGSTYRCHILITSYNSSTFAIWFQTSTQAPVAVSLGSNVSLSSSNPDVDNDVNIWPSASTTISIKNRMGSSRSFTLYSIGL